MGGSLGSEELSSLNSLVSWSDRDFDPVGSPAIRPWRVWEPVALGVAEPVRSVRAIHLGLEVPRE